MLFPVALVFMLGAYGLAELLDYLCQSLSEVRRYRLQTAAAIVFGLYTVSNGVESLAGNSLFDRKQPVEAIATEWFEETVPARARVVIRGERVWPGHQTIPLFDLSENYRHRLARAGEPGMPVRYLSALPSLAAIEDVKRYNLTVVDRYARWRTLEDYLDEGIQYFVIHKEAFLPDFTDIRSLVGHQTRVDFYTQIQISDEVVFEKRFAGQTVQGVPKTIEVYRSRDLKPTDETLTAANDQQP
jgi:hypothetical protein